MVEFMKLRSNFSWVKAYFTLLYGQSSADLLQTSLSSCIFISSQFVTVLNRRVYDKKIYIFTKNSCDQPQAIIRWRYVLKTDSKHERVTAYNAAQMWIDGLELQETRRTFRGSQSIVPNERLNSRMQSDCKGFLYETQALLCLQIFFSISHKTQVRV